MTSNTEDKTLPTATASKIAATADGESDTPHSHHHRTKKKKSKKSKHAHGAGGARDPSSSEEQKAAVEEEEPKGAAESPSRKSKKKKKKHEPRPPPAHLKAAATDWIPRPPPAHTKPALEEKGGEATATAKTKTKKKKKKKKKKHASHSSHSAHASHSDDDGDDDDAEEESKSKKKKRKKKHGSSSHTTSHASHSDDDGGAEIEAEEEEEKKSKKKKKTHEEGKDEAAGDSGEEYGTVATGKLVDVEQCNALLLELKGRHKMLKKAGDKASAKEIESMFAVIKERRSYLASLSSSATLTSGGEGGGGEQRHDAEHTAFLARVQTSLVSVEDAEALMGKLKRQHERMRAIGEHDDAESVGKKFKAVKLHRKTLKAKRRAKIEALVKQKEALVQPKPRAKAAKAKEGGAAAQPSSRNAQHAKSVATGARRQSLEALQQRVAEAAAAGPGAGEIADQLASNPLIYTHAFQLAGALGITLELRGGSAAAWVVTANAAAEAEHASDWVDENMRAGAAGEERLPTAGDRLLSVNGRKCEVVAPPLGGGGGADLRTSIDGRDLRLIIEGGERPLTLTLLMPSSTAERMRWLRPLPPKREKLDGLFFRNDSGTAVALRSHAVGNSTNPIRLTGQRVPANAVVRVRARQAGHLQLPDYGNFWVLEEIPAALPTWPPCVLFAQVLTGSFQNVTGRALVPRAEARWGASPLKSGVALAPGAVCEVGATIHVRHAELCPYATAVGGDGDAAARAAVGRRRGRGGGECGCRTVAFFELELAAGGPSKGWLPEWEESKARVRHAEAGVYHRCLELVGGAPGSGSEDDNSPSAANANAAAGGSACAAPASRRRKSIVRANDQSPSARSPKRLEAEKARAAESRPEPDFTRFGVDKAAVPLLRNAWQRANVGTLSPAHFQERCDRLGVALGYLRKLKISLGWTNRQMDTMLAQAKREVKLEV